MSGVDGPDPEPQEATPPEDVPRDRRDGTLLWVGTGAVLGLVALIVFGGGLGADRPPRPAAAGTAGGAATQTAATTDGGERPTPVATTTRPSDSSADRTPTTATATTPSAPAPARRALELQVAALPTRPVYLEVRRASATNPPIFAGTLPAGTSRSFRNPAGRPFWLAVAWAPNVIVRVNGRRVAAPGGTEAFRVTAAGLEKLTNLGEGTG